MLHAYTTLDLSSSSTATSSSTSVAVNEVQSAAMEPPAAKRNRTEDSSPEVAEITD